MNLQGKNVLITGGSSGIGKALIDKLVEKGAQVVNLSRRPYPTQHEQVQNHAIDLRDGAALLGLLESPSIKDVGFDLLINNAGLGYFGYLEEQKWEQIEEQYAVNVLALLQVTRAVLPYMKAKKEGHIVNISSTGGLEGLAQVSTYCGTKWAVRGISDSLFKELRPFGIKVTCIFPGSTNTSFFDQAVAIDAHDNMMDPAEVAQQIIGCVEASSNFLVNELVFRPLDPKPKD